MRKSHRIKWTVLFLALFVLAGCTGTGEQKASSSLISSTTPTENVWTWMGGSNSVNQPGTYGTKGAGSASNTPGARYSAALWSDVTGTAWLFGGYGYDANGDPGYLNDLWRFDSGTGQWTWISGEKTAGQQGSYGTKGTASSTNVPGARYSAVSWRDASGNLWLFGGGYYNASGSGNYFNDLWKYDPSTGYWIWVSGSDTVNQMGTYGTQGTADAANVPGARDQAVSWIDPSGNLWLFGGYGFSSNGFGHLNDLWKYDPTGNQWTWVSGSKIQDQAGNYGTQGTAASSNVPGARDQAISWIDGTGNLWLFGGYGLDCDFNFGTPGPLNDLWKFDGKNWTWVSGSDHISQYGSYGWKGNASSGNTPGARSGGVSWIDPDGNLWLFGGYGYASSLYVGALNDLWKFDPVSGYWTWVSGANTGNQTGTYGTKGVASRSNIPGARTYQPVSCIDGNGDLWLFGGAVYNSGGTLDSFNDVWRYQPEKTQQQ